MVNHLSVELFKDVDTPSADLEVAVEGLAMVNGITNNSLELVASKRKMRVSKANDATIRPYAINWPNLSTDINIVVSSKRLLVKNASEPLGFSERNPTRGGGNALVTTSGLAVIEPIFTTAHEIGHLLGLRYGKDTYHCPDNTCIMHSRSQRTEFDTRQKQKGIKALLERSGYIPARYETTHSVSNQSFCMPCQEQLARKTFFLIKLRNGDYVPESFL